MFTLVKGANTVPRLGPTKNENRQRGQRLS
jgi:hypothetical protein